MSARNPLSNPLDSYPLDWTNKILSELHELLIRAYPNQADARMLADQAGLDPGTFPIRPENMRQLWKELCEVLAEQGYLRRLVEIARDDPAVAAFRERFNEILKYMSTALEESEETDAESAPERELLFIHEELTRVYASKTEEEYLLRVTALVFDVDCSVSEPMRHIWGED